jgi:dolichyl-phosphate-mannose--protein O-mannosyl transferase
MSWEQIFVRIFFVWYLTGVLWSALNFGGIWHQIADNCKNPVKPHIITISAILIIVCVYGLLGPMSLIIPMRDSK